MLRIGEAAKQFNISNRTLRYWEEMGILKSARAENGYRFYDAVNAARINEIVLLRKLRMPIADIERVFTADDFNAAIDALNNHLESLKQDISVNEYLIVLIEKLLQNIRASQNLEQMFLYLETHDAIISSTAENTPQIQLSEREIVVSTEKLSNVRIVRLPAMTVAAYRAESATPEKDCSEVMTPFVLHNKLNEKSGFRHFGFNNPCPTDNNPAYGYEMWVTVSTEFNVPAPLIKKQIPGGLYASISTHLNEIGERWQRLSNWVINNDKYIADESLQCLEECIDFETFIAAEGNDSVQQLDLLEPIKVR